MSVGCQSINIHVFVGVLSCQFKNGHCQRGNSREEVIIQYLLSKGQ